MGRFKPTLAILLLPVFILGSCDFFKGEPSCSSFIPRRKMANVLTDVFLLESRVTNLAHREGVTDSLPIYYAGLFQKHEITRQQFEKAYECYMLNPEDMTWLMDEVLSTLSIMQSKLDEKSEDLQVQ